MRGLLAVAAFLVLLAPAVAQQQPAAAPPAAPSPVAPQASAAPTFVRAHHPVSTASDVAQAAFDDGLTLLYAFNPGDARRAFERASTADPRLAMAQWGIAMSHGININTSYDPAAQRDGQAAIARARALQAGASPAERALIDATRVRFSYTGKSDGDASARAYATAMDGVAAAFPDDDIVTLDAEAAMDERPWGYWTDDGKPQPGTLDIVRKLEGVLGHDPTHFGAAHLLLHAYEASPMPQRALDAAHSIFADTFEPAAEHLTHMPAHIFMRTGEYDLAGESNRRALDAFQIYLDGPHAPGHEGYWAHDCAFGVDAYMMSGERAKALAIAARCHTAANRYLGNVNVRFRTWAALAPYTGESQFLVGMFAASKNDAAATLAAAGRLDAQKDDVATIAADILRARVRRMHGETLAEIASLTKAVREQDKLDYAEPPRFFYPVRESLGGAYYRAARFAEAEAAFRADLARNPRNPRSLFGLANALRAEGRAADALATDHEFALAWSKADTPLTMDDL
jgi:tetratricopeptide (TPR) repeat protein